MGKHRVSGKAIYLQTIETRQVKTDKSQHANILFYQYTVADFNLSRISNWPKFKNRRANYIKIKFVLSELVLTLLHWNACYCSGLCRFRYIFT